METNAAGIRALHIPATHGDPPVGWKWRRLDDLCNGIYDCPHSTPKLTTSGPYIVRTQDFSTGIFREDRAARVSEQTYLERTARVVPSRGDVLYSREGSYSGVAAAVPEDTRLCLGQRMVLVRPNPEQLHYRFLRYWLNSPVMAAYVKGFREGSAAERLNLPTIRALPVLCPPINDQLDIAEALSVLDTKVANNEQIASISRDLGRALFAKAINVGEVETVETSSISASIARGGTPTYVSDDHGTTIINQKCIRDGRVNLGPARLTDSAKVRADRILRERDILVNSTGVGTLGRVAIWTGDSAATCDSHITVVRIDPALAEPLVAGYALLIAQPEIELLGEGSTGQTELSRHKLGQLKVTLPVGPAQVELAMALDALEQRSINALQENALLLALRNALLPKLISGELRIRGAERLASEAV